MSRDRSTKALAKRIELDYFKRQHPWRLSMMLATVLAPVISALWLALVIARTDQQVFSSGPVSTRHAMFGQDCMQCHQAWNGTPDNKCIQCHEAPKHHDNEAFTPACASCHVEHKGHNKLATMTDQHCNRCHADLTTKGTSPIYFPRIRTFTDGHPEFAIIRTGDKDKAALSLNHKVHLKAGLQGADGPVQLTCTSCHEPDSSGLYMAPVTFEKHCKGCHPLKLGLTVPGGIAPHREPNDVIASIRQQLHKQAEEHPEVLKPEQEEDSGSRRRGRRRGGDDEESAAKATPVATDVWVAAQSADIEKTMFGKTCKLCHAMKLKDVDVPQVVPTKVPARWFDHARFSHRAHRTLTCVACHLNAPTSTETTDVLLAPMVRCAVCHSPEGGARSSCSECHLYHDKKKEGVLDGPMQIAPFAIKARETMSQNTGK